MFVELKGSATNKNLAWSSFNLSDLPSLQTQCSGLRGVLQYLNKDPAGASSSKASSHNSTILQKKKNSILKKKVFVLPNWIFPHAFFQNYYYVCLDSAHAERRELTT